MITPDLPYFHCSTLPILGNSSLNWSFHHIFSIVSAIGQNCLLLRNPYRAEMSSAKKSTILGLETTLEVGWISLEIAGDLESEGSQDNFCFLLAGKSTSLQ